MILKKAIFQTSIANPERLPRDGLPEIAVVGKSNVGKSSFINYLTGNSRLAKTSKEPGRTRLINFFICNDIFALVDLPGYGFARVSDAEKKRWASLIEGYFRLSMSLTHVFLLIDIRRDPSDDDKVMINYLYHYHIPFTLIITKSDKIGKTLRQRRAKEIANQLSLGVDNLVMVSSKEFIGREEVLNVIEGVLENAKAHQDGSNLS
ncbi:MAG: ribosome biogenesis GTP-binding protein YihA/YsxC [Christensenellaceae bacterium]|jgi:GTP-binding protein|nr:ribosome biogenesis GTP-binding protein YihA/YsxC [Christensenellaceae bacterium]